MWPGSKASRPEQPSLRIWGCRARFYRLILISALILTLFDSAQGINFTLFSLDGSYYPHLDYLLQNPNTSYVVGSVQEIRGIPLYNASRQSVSIPRKLAVVSESFFSVFSSAQVQLWGVDNSSKAVVPVVFEVGKGAELLLLGFTLNWSASASSQRPNTSSSTLSDFPALNALLDKLSLYVRLSGTARLQLLRTNIVGITCDALLKIYGGLKVLQSQELYLQSIAAGIHPQMRLVYPYLFVKYAQLGPIWVEDVTLSCADSANLTAAACPAEPPTVHNITSHDDIVSVLTALERTDVPSCVTTRTVLRLVKDVRLDESRWPRAEGGIFITSNVSFECGPGEQRILDFDGGLNLFKLRAAAYVRVVNLVVTNLPLAPVGVYVVPLWSFSFPRELTPKVESRLHMVNTTGIIPPDEFVQLTYWTVVLDNPQEAIKMLAGWQRLIQPDLKITTIDNTTVGFKWINGMGITCVNIILTSKEDLLATRNAEGANLTMPLAPTGVNQLLGNSFAGPPYTIAVYGTAQLKRILSLPDFRIARLAAQDGLTNGNTTDVLLLLQNNITMDSESWPAGVTLQVRRKISIQGRPFQNIWLDFGGGTGYMSATGNGFIQFSYLTLLRPGWVANYTADNAAKGLNTMQFLQLGMWPVVFDRSALPKLKLVNVTLLVSEPEMQLLLACVASYQAGDQGAAYQLPGALTPDMCQQVMPSNAAFANVSQEDLSMFITTVSGSAFIADNLRLAVDPGLQRPDLEVLLQGGYPAQNPGTSNPSTPSSPGDSGGSGGGTNTGAIIGAAVGATIGCILIVAAVFFYFSRRSRARAEEQQLRGLQEKQAHQLEELSKTNPLAQLILDHLAGKDPGAAQLVVCGKANTSGSVAADPSCAGSVSGGPDGGTRTGSSGAGAAAACASAAGGGGGATATGSAGSTQGGLGSREDAVVAGAGDGGSGGAQATPVNIAATDLTELFKHLTILGVANLPAAHSVDGNNQQQLPPLDSRGSRGSRARTSPNRPHAVGSTNGAGAAAAARGSGARGKAGQSGRPQSLSTLSGFAAALAQRLHFRMSLNSAGDSETAGTGAVGNPLHDGRLPVERASTPGGGGKAAAGYTAAAAAAGAGVAASATKGAAQATEVALRVDSRGRGAANGTDKVAAGDAADRGGSEAAGAVDGKADGTDGKVSSVDAVKAAAGGGRCSDDSGSIVAVPTVPDGLPEELTQSPVLEELLRLSLDLAGEIDDNQLTVTEVVASGGFGTVYKGLWHNLPVAVKIVLFSTASVNRRIALQEAALSKSISHPNIIATYAVDAKPMAVLGRAGGAVGRGSSTSRPAQSSSGRRTQTLAEIQEWRLYIIQEFADGGTLRRALDRGSFHDPHSGLPRLEMLLDIAQGVASALAHLHSKNVVHGDLNPKNVLLKIAPPPPSSGFGGSMRGSGKGGWPSAAVHPAKPAGAHPAFPGSAGSSGDPTASQYGNYPLVGRCGFAVKVADFGLSVKMENSHISGLRQGTPFYAAPELSMGMFSRAADMYAFGVLLWELYWGRPIWVPDARAPGGYVQHEDFPLLPHGCPPEYIALVGDCLHPNHLQRPSFEEILMRLRVMAQMLIFGPVAAATLPTSSLNSYDSSCTLSMPGLPLMLHGVPPQGYAAHQQHQLHGGVAHTHAQAQVQAQAQAQATAQRQAAAAAIAAAATGAAFGTARHQQQQQHQQQQFQQRHRTSTDPAAPAGAPAFDGGLAGGLHGTPLLPQARATAALPQAGQQQLSPPALQRNPSGSVAFAELTKAGVTAPAAATSAVGGASASPAPAPAPPALGGQWTPQMTPELIPPTAQAAPSGVEEARPARAHIPAVAPPAALSAVPSAPPAPLGMLEVEPLVYVSPAPAAAPAALTVPQPLYAAVPAELNAAPPAKSPSGAAATNGRGTVAATAVAGRVVGQQIPAEIAQTSDLPAAKNPAVTELSGCGSASCINGQNAPAGGAGGGGNGPALSGLSSPLDTRALQCHIQPAGGCYVTNPVAGGGAPPAQPSPEVAEGRVATMAAVAEAEFAEHGNDPARISHQAGLEGSSALPAAADGLAMSPGGGPKWGAAGVAAGAAVAAGVRASGTAHAVMAAAGLEAIQEEDAEESEDSRRAWRIGV